MNFLLQTVFIKLWFELKKYINFFLSNHHHYYNYITNMSMCNKKMNLRHKLTCDFLFIVLCYLKIAERLKIEKKKHINIQDS